MGCKQCSRTVCANTFVKMILRRLSYQQQKHQQWPSLPEELPAEAFVAFDIIKVDEALHDNRHRQATKRRLRC